MRFSPGKALLSGVQEINALMRFSPGKAFLFGVQKINVLMRFSPGKVYQIDGMSMRKMGLFIISWFQVECYYLSEQLFLDNYL